MNLDTFFQAPRRTKPGTYDIVFSTSVLEHVKDDETFVRQAADLLAAGRRRSPDVRLQGKAIQAGDPVISGDFSLLHERGSVEAPPGELERLRVTSTRRSGTARRRTFRWAASTTPSLRLVFKKALTPVVKKGISILVVSHREKQLRESTSSVCRSGAALKRARTSHLQIRRIASTRTEYRARGPRRPPQR